MSELRNLRPFSGDHGGHIIIKGIVIRFLKYFESESLIKILIARLGWVNGDMGENGTTTFNFRSNDPSP